MDKLGEYVEFLVKSICKNADMVKVDINNDNEEIVINVLVAKDDIGAVIGKAGKMASSIRTLIFAYAYLQQLGKVKVNFDTI